eukprot:TRINITY_DN387_c4_g1_i1.p1 TRINITY_DN387_c4_g1~~TRINITY_DN387_c4_g1_i1.p1  ORF type:complete len:547 (+),score=161.28 TRINITY_DN387_c4_g1_i1:95-1735(+)
MSASESDPKSSEESGTNGNKIIRGTLNDKWSQANWEAEAPEILPDQIKFGKKLAQGSFGTVYKGKCRGEIVAIKELTFETEIDEEILEEFRREVAIMSHLRHPNIVLLMGACTQGPRLCIVTEFLPGGDLDKMLEEGPKVEFSLPTKIRVLQDVALGMNWLHCSSPPIIHRDLKPSNILLTQDQTAKVGDLGLSAIQKKKKIKSYGAGSYLWMAPEALRNQPHSEKADVYSFAIVMWQVICWDPNPFNEYLEKGDLDGLIDAVCDKHERPPIPKTLHSSLASIIQDSWHHKPKLRPSFGEIIVRLDDAMISSSFHDEKAAQFWRERWGRVEKNKVIETTKLEVPFREFAKELYKHVNVKYPKDTEKEDTKFLCLKAISNIKDLDSNISLERFALITKWFGDLVRSDNRTILDEIFDVISQSWFHGDISKQEAQNLLNTVDSTKKRSNIYLVRLSTSEPIHENPFTITKLNKELKIVHQRIYLENGELFVTVKEGGKSKKIGTTQGLVHLIKLMEEPKLLRAGRTLPRTKYEDIFNQGGDDMGYLDT